MHRTPKMFEPSSDNAIENFRIFILKAWDKLSATQWQWGDGTEMDLSGKKMLIEGAWNFFTENEDPLRRARSYLFALHPTHIGSNSLSAWINDKDLPDDGIDYIDVLAISELLTRTQLDALVNEFGALRGSMNYADLANRQFTVKRGMFQKAFTIKGARIEKLLPKLHLPSKLTQERYLGLSSCFFQGRKELYTR
jgi:hypothetical protein